LFCTLELSERRSLVNDPTRYEARSGTLNHETQVEPSAVLAQLLWVSQGDQMANVTWKKFEGSEGYRKTKLFLRRITGKELWLRPDVQVQRSDCGDWLISTDDFPAGGIVYSVGVGDNIDFDLALIQQYGAEVHAFDPTPASVTWLEAHQPSPDFHFHPWAVTGHDGFITLYPRARRDGSASDVMYTMVRDAGAAGDGVEVPGFSLPTLMQKLGHNRVDLLKIDIEGAEYEVLDTLIASSARPAQLLVEFHHRFPSIDKSMTADRVERLRMIGYRVFTVSSTGREISFVRRSQSTG
jgi:FkbM family methyltransferase